MDVNSPLMLSPDVAMIAIERLAADVRERLDYAEGDVALTRLHTRSSSIIVDADIAALLKEFHKPTRIVDAVIRHSRAAGADPQVLLEIAFPAIDRLLGDRVLIDPAAATYSAGTPSLRTGTRLGQVEILGPVQVLDDSEVYKARRPDGSAAVLKIAQTLEVHAQMHREARILAALNGVVTPSLLHTGEFEGRPYLVAEWCFGVPCTTVADELRGGHAASVCPGLLDLAKRIVQAYSTLHSQGVAHGDVHPRNVLVDRDGKVKIIDFGLANAFSCQDVEPPPYRGGVGFFFDPQFAEARLSSQTPPPPTPASDQYGIGALLYLLFTGCLYLDFPLEEQGVMLAIMNSAMKPFGERDFAPWEAVEEVVATALSKDPNGRHPSLASMAAKLESVKLASERPDAGLARGVSVVERRASEFLAELLERLGPEGQVMRNGLAPPPVCSINYGAAGIALALHRIALIRDDAAALALADRWLQQAMHHREAAGAFYNESFNVTRQTVGHISPFHCASGLFLVDAMLSRTMGDLPAMRRAIRAFVGESQQICDGIDLTLGRSGVLVASALLVEGATDDDIDCRSALLALGDPLAHAIEAAIRGLGPIRECSELDYLGVAHGWAGVLFALMRWHQATKRLIGPHIEARLDELAACAEPVGRGVRFRPRTLAADPEGKQGFMAGWCNGTAGMVHVFSLAYELTGAERHLCLAERAGWHVWEDVSANKSLCCGLAGRAYGLLSLVDQTKDVRWLDRARTLMHRAVAGAPDIHPFRNSLYKGDVGVGLLVAEMAEPELAAMPMFEAEGWSRCTRKS